MASTNRTIVVTGATGLQGGAVARCLLRDGWQVRALTRNASSDKAKSLAALGAEVRQGDMEHAETLAPIFEGAHGVYSVQNNWGIGTEREIQQGKNVADAAKRAGVQHVVYGSAGVGRRDTGVPSWNSKIAVEDYMNSLNLPLTVLIPMAFMELMTDPKYYPQASTWHLMPKLMGASRKVGWLSAGDLGEIAAKAFADPDQYIGKRLSLVSDAKSNDEARAQYTEVLGKKPPRFPMPVWLFKRFVGDDLLIMWRWLHDNDLDFDTSQTKATHPEALTVRDWLIKQRAKS